jgi:Tfp pilus assembly protein PilF
MRAIRAMGRITQCLAAIALAAVIPAVPAYAEAMAKVQGTITDVSGQPLAKVEVVIENAVLKDKRLGPIKTKKNGRYIFPFVDTAIENEWRVVPKLEGYKILKVTWKHVDSQKQDRGSGTQTLNAKQEIPVVKPVLVGDVGVNEVDYVMVKEADFESELRKLAGGTPAAPAEAPVPAAGETPPEPAAAPVSGKSITDALDLMKAGKDAEAIPIFTEHLGKNPNNAPVQLTLGRAYVNTKQYDLAIPPLQTALRVNPSQEGAHFYLGIAYSSLGQDEAALQEFLAEIPISPDQDVAYSNAAAIYEKQGKMDEALEYYKKAAEINPQRPELHASLAKIYELKGNQAAAEAEYKALAAADPANAATTWYNIGAIAYNSDKNDDAVRAFRRAVDLDPSHGTAHRELGFALVKQGEFAQAVVHFKKYLELMPKAPDAASIRQMIQDLSR